MYPYPVYPNDNIFQNYSAASYHTPPRVATGAWVQGPE